MPIEVVDGIKEGLTCFCNNKEKFYRLKTPEGSNSPDIIICDWCGRSNDEDYFKDPDWIKKKYKGHCWVCKGKGEIFIDLSVHLKAKNSGHYGGAGSAGSFMLCKKCAKKMVLPVKFAPHVFHEEKKESEQASLEGF